MLNIGTYKTDNETTLRLNWDIGAIVYSIVSVFNIIKCKFGMFKVCVLLWIHFLFIELLVIYFLYFFCIFFLYFYSSMFISAMRIFIHIWSQIFVWCLMNLTICETFLIACLSIYCISNFHSSWFTQNVYLIDEDAITVPQICILLICKDIWVLWKERYHDI